MYRSLTLFACLALAACNQSGPVDEAATTMNIDENLMAAPADTQSAEADRYKVSGLVDDKQWNGPERIVVLLPDEGQEVGGQGLLVAYLNSPNDADGMKDGQEATLSCSEAGTTPDGVEYHGCALS
jgi:hypothetical protein